MSPDLEAERRVLAEAFRRGDGASDAIMIRAVDALMKSWPRNFAEMARDELLAEVLRSVPVGPVWFEQRMTGLRRKLLFSPATPGAGPLLAAVAIQCQLNEYAWAEEPGEAEFVSHLIDQGGRLTPEQVMAVACYRPLASLAIADDLLAKGWSGPVEEVLREQIVTVREEREIAAGLPALTPIRGGVSQDVRGQYEEHPYPRWRRVMKPAPVREIQGRPAPLRPHVLVAGCGTGRQAILAAQWLGAERTVAVDLSRRSLAYTVRKTRELGLSDIVCAQADLLELPAHHPEAFDVVTCVGVLHHLADPFEGARAVCKVLKPGGLLNLGLYSATARAGLKPAKALAQTYTPQTLRELRQAIIAAPQDDPVRAPVLSRDFYAASSCRDLLMHVQEHELGFADLRRILTENGLRFLGFIQSDAVMAAYRAAFPHDPHGLDLSAWEAFETRQPDTFARMYMFWAEKPPA